MDESSSVLFGLSCSGKIRCIQQFLHKLLINFKKSQNELWTISYYLVHIIFMTVLRITYDLQVRMLNYMFRYARFLTLVMEYS